MISRVIVAAVLGLTFYGCDKGLGPTTTAPAVPMGYMSGMIRYQHWPPSDSLFDLRLVAFRVFPPTNIVNEYQLGRAVAYPPLGGSSLPFYVDSLRYGFFLPPGQYQYVAIAQQFGPTITTDWRAVGQYDLDSNLFIPSPVMIVENDTTHDINFNVDFTNPPPPPFP